MNLLLTVARLADWYKASYNDYTENDKQRQVCSRRGAPLQFLPEGKKMELQWHKLPSIHSTRWNSRGIFALIAFFLIPKWRDHLKTACDFSATTWSKAWLSNKHYTEDSYNQLHTALSKLNCPKALRCFSTHWIKERSVLDVPRSNMVAKRAVKLMLHSTCKTDKYLNSKFINSNSSKLLNAMGSSIYDVHTEGRGVRLRWTGGGVQPHVDVHRKLKLESTYVILSSSHAKKLASFLPEFRLWTE